MLFGVTSLILYIESEESYFRGVGDIQSGDVTIVEDTVNVYRDVYKKSNGDILRIRRK